MYVSGAASSIDPVPAPASSEARGSKRWPSVFFAHVRNPEVFSESVFQASPARCGDAAVDFVGNVRVSRGRVGLEVGNGLLAVSVHRMHAGFDVGRREGFRRARWRR